MQERRNSIANALELRLTCINQSIFYMDPTNFGQTQCQKWTTIIHRGKVSEPTISSSYPHFVFITMTFIMSAMASQITSLTIVYSTVYSGADQRKHQSSASLAFVQGIQRGPVNSPNKGPVTRKMFPFDDVIMFQPFSTRGAAVDARKLVQNRVIKHCKLKQKQIPVKSFS